MEKRPMKSKSRRFEVLLPTRLNDGRAVPDSWLAEAVNDLVVQFKAATLYDERAEGYWQQEDTVYRDELALLVVDIADTARNRQWMRKFKERWRVRLEQIEVWMVSYRIEIE
jgi:hypothetical protein